MSGLATGGRASTVGCAGSNPRQDSNLRAVTQRARVAGESAMTADVLIRLGEWASGDATPLDVDLGAVDLGGDPLSRNSVVDLAVLGIVWAAWRQGPVEDWHGARRIGQVDMMRANAAITRQVRDLLCELLPERWWTWDVRVGLRTEALVLWTVLAREIGTIDRHLPDGCTVAELAPDDEEAVDYRNHVLWCRSRWLALTAEYGLRVVLMMLACAGAWKCRRWWLHPDWPSQVDEFIGYLHEPMRHPKPEVAAAIPELQRQGRLAHP